MDYCLSRCSYAKIEFKLTKLDCILWPININCFCCVSPRWQPPKQYQPHSIAATRFLRNITQKIITQKTTYFHFIFVQDLLFASGMA